MGEEQIPVGGQKDKETNRWKGTVKKRKEKSLIPPRVKPNVQCQFRLRFNTSYVIP